MVKIFIMVPVAHMCLLSACFGTIYLKYVTIAFTVTKVSIIDTMNIKIIHVKILPTLFSANAYTHFCLAGISSFNDLSIFWVGRPCGVVLLFLVSIRVLSVDIFYNDPPRPNS